MEQKDKENIELVESSRPISKIDMLIRNGLGNISKLYFYRQVIADPTQANRNPMLRPYVSEVAEQTLDLIFSDPQLWSRFYTLLQRQHMVDGPVVNETLLQKLRRVLEKSGDK